MSKHPEEKYAPASGADEASGQETPAGNDKVQAEEAAENGEFRADHEAFLRLAEENKELNDRTLRLAAEMENLRKRTARDVHDARAYAISAFARDMLGVSDNLRRALDAIPPEALNEDNQGLKSLAEGVEMTAREMLNAMERHGVKKLEARGGRFDPHFHQAMFEVPNPEVPNNTVVEVVQEGYVIGDRVLRPAMVGVAKGGPAAAPENQPEPEPGPPNAQAERDA